MTTIVKAPGVVKLTGEHAVVYGKLSVAVAIRLFAQAEVGNWEEGQLKLELPKYNVSAILDATLLDSMYAKYKSRKSIAEFISACASYNLSEHALPYAVIASRLRCELGADVCGKRVRVTSGIPAQSGAASSASCSTAFTVAMAKAADTVLEDETCIDVARDGERVVHKSEGAGRIDVSTSYYGGYVSYSQADGPKRESIAAAPRLLLINTGPKKSTAETVGHVAELYKADPRAIGQVMDGINACSTRALSALRAGDMKALGTCMLEDQELLKRLDVSSEGLDRAVKISMSFGALGAKLSGGGGGGLAIALLQEDPHALTAALESEGFALFAVDVALGGASSYAKKV